MVVLGCMCPGPSKNKVLSEIHILFPFHLILTSEPILIAKNHQRVVLSLRMLFKVVFRCAFY